MGSCKLKWRFLALPVRNVIGTVHSARAYNTKKTLHRGSWVGVEPHTLLVTSADDLP